MYACSAQNVTVVADMPPNGQPTNDVKTYPAVQEDYNSTPVSQYSSLVASFGGEGPAQPGDDYEYAFDIWLNGMATTTSNELMIWTDNFGQTPAGSQQATISIDGHTWEVYATSGYRYVAFVATQNFSSGSLDLMPFIDWAIQQGWYPSTTFLSQVNYGIEICSTDFASATFTLLNFGLQPTPAS